MRRKTRHTDRRIKETERNKLRGRVRENEIETETDRDKKAEGRDTQRERDI